MDRQLTWLVSQIAPALRAERGADWSVPRNYSSKRRVAWMISDAVRGQSRKPRGRQRLAHLADGEGSGGLATTLSLADEASRPVAGRANLARGREMDLGRARFVRDPGARSPGRYLPETFVASQWR